jgi:uncharacterized membrane protein YccC
MQPPRYPNLRPEAVLLWWVCEVGAVIASLLMTVIDPEVPFIVALTLVTVAAGIAIFGDRLSR